MDVNGCINKAVSKHDQATTGVGRGGRGRVNTVYISIYRHVIHADDWIHSK